MLQLVAPLPLVVVVVVALLPVLLLNDVNHPVAGERLLLGLLPSPPPPYHLQHQQQHPMEFPPAHELRQLHLLSGPPSLGQAGPPILAPDPLLPHLCPPLAPKVALSVSTIH